MSDLRNLKWDAERRNVGNVALNSGTLAIGTTPAQAQTDAAVAYTINGIFYSKAATDGFALTGDVQAAETKRLYVFTLDAAGTIACVPGVSVAATSTPKYPAVGADVAVFGAVQVETAEATTFDPGTTSLAAAGITDTYINLSRIPA